MGIYESVRVLPLMHIRFLEHQNLRFNLQQESRARMQGNRFRCV